MADLSIPVLNAEGAETRRIPLDAEALGGTPRAALLKQVLVGTEANRRVGTSCTKTRGEVAGGGRKPWRQKGTGRARVGSSRSPLWRGGGVAGGPRPRKYTKHTPVRMRRAALASAILGKAVDGALAAFEGVKFTSGKTKDVVSFLKKAKVEGRCLLGMAALDDAVRRACRNVPWLNLKTVAGIGAYDVAEANRIYIAADAVEALVTRATASSKRAGEAKP